MDPEDNGPDEYGVCSRGCDSCAVCPEVVMLSED